jgi:hypothetical protein
LPWGFAALAAGTIGAAVIGSSAAGDAANTEANAANNASQVQLGMFNKTQANEAPYLAAGGNALTALQTGLGIGPGTNGSGTGPLNKPFTLSDFQNSPGYQFQVQQGENAVLNNKSALGGVNSGNTLKALTSYGQGVANQDYWNAYNAYVNAQNQKFGQLQTVAGSGQNAAGNLGALGTQVGASVGNNIVNAGNASAAGTVGSANAISNGINGLGQNYLLASALNSGSLGSGGFSFLGFGG